MLYVFGILAALCAPASAQEAGQPDPRLVSCIAHIVYGEARSEPIEGQYMVAWSLIFRAAVNQPDFGGSDICDVAYKYKSSRNRWQYDGAKTAPKDNRAWYVSLYVATMTLMGQGEPNLPIMYFCAPGSCKWHERDAVYVGQVGGHRFYLDPRFPAIVEASAQ
jgi:spore germination cell wall hydrolase CwlJ-like protein